MYEYDGLNRLVAANENGQSLLYGYNSNNLRSYKTVNGLKTDFIWDGQEIAAELNGEGYISNKYLRGMGLIYSCDDSGVNKAYYLYNGHGDVIQLTSDIGSVIRSYEYDAFGNEQNPDPTDSNPFRYCGEYFDKETGTIYLRARYYDPGIGRFISEDSVWSKKFKFPNGQEYEDPLSLNLYTYCTNNPIIYIDSSGRSYELVQELKDFAQQAAMSDGPYPFGDAIAAGVLVFAGGVWVWDNKDEISDGIKWTGNEIRGWFIDKSDRVDWDDINDNTKNHILKGTNNGHVNGWKKFGIDPNDPKSFATLLPVLKEAVDKGKETIRNVDGGRVVEYVYSLKDKAMDIWVRVFEYSDGTRIITDAAEYISK